MIDPFPWEVAEERVTIIDEKWRALRNAPDFIRYWRGEAAEDVCVFRLSVAAYIKDFVHAEVRTMLSIWYSKQGKKFDRAAWEKYTQPNALKKAAEARSKRTRLSWKQYRKEVQQIEANPMCAEFPRYWIACLLDGSRLSADPAWSLQEIRELTRLPEKDIRGALALLGNEGRIERMSDGSVKAIRSTFWDTIHRDIRKTAGVTWNHIVQDGDVKRMECFDVRSGEYTSVLYDAQQEFLLEAEELHWIVNHGGEVVRRDVGSIFPGVFRDCEDWTRIGYKNGLKTDCRLENLVSMDDLDQPPW